MQEDSNRISKCWEKFFNPELHMQKNYFLQTSVKRIQFQIKKNTFISFKNFTKLPSKNIFRKKWSRKENMKR